MKQKEQIREATNDLANTIIDGDNVLLSQAREIMNHPEFTLQQKGRLMGNLRGLALAKAYPDKSARKRAVGRMMS